MLDTLLTAVVRVDPQGRLLVPREIRDAVDMRPGEKVTLLVEDGELVVLTLTAGRARLREIAARYSTPGRSLVDELIAERHAEAARE